MTYLYQNNAIYKYVSTYNAYIPIYNLKRVPMEFDFNNY